MSAYNKERERCVNIIEQEFREVTKLPPSFSLDEGKKFIKRLTTLLRDLPSAANDDEGMADILLPYPKGKYDGKVVKIEAFIEKYKDKSAGVIEFAYTTEAANAGAEIGIKKGVVNLFRKLLSHNVWQTHLVEETGENKALCNIVVYNIIKAIKTEAIKPGSADTNVHLLH